MSTLLFIISFYFSQTTACNRQSRYYYYMGPNWGPKKWPVQIYMASEGVRAGVWAFCFKPRVLTSAHHLLRLTRWTEQQRCHCREPGSQGWMSGPWVRVLALPHTSHMCIWRYIYEYVCMRVCVHALPLTFPDLTFSTLKWNDASLSPMILWFPGVFLELLPLTSENHGDLLLRWIRQSSGTMVFTIRTQKVED